MYSYSCQYVPLKTRGRVPTMGEQDTCGKPILGADFTSKTNSHTFRFKTRSLYTRLSQEHKQVNVHYLTTAARTVYHPVSRCVTEKRQSIKLEPDKCEFLRKEVYFLGYKITADEVAMNERKAAVIKKKNNPVPTNTRQLKSFLGIAGFYRKYVPRFSSIASFI